VQGGLPYTPWAAIIRKQRFEVGKAKYKASNCYQRNARNRRRREGVMPLPPRNGRYNLSRFSVPRPENHHHRFRSLVHAIRVSLIRSR
jgi:hypothetical protein